MPAGSTWKRTIRWGGILSAFALVPAVLCQWLAAPPVHRAIHVEAFRYGKDPSVIRCNRGDWLHLTFSSRKWDRGGTIQSDTGHSFFLEEFDIDAKITPGRSEVEVFPAATPAPGRIEREVVVKAEHPGWLRYLVSKSMYRCHVWCGPMHAFEQGKLVIEPNTLLFAALGLVVGIPAVGWLSLRDRLAGRGAPLAASAGGRDLLAAFPRLKRWLRRREFPLVLVLATMAGLYLVILAMLFGTKVAGRNFGSTMTWIVWLALLTAVLTPLGGRIWCMACPLPLLGDVLQRRALIGVRTGTTRGYKNRFFGLNLAWPQWLANDWPRIAIFLLLGTFSSALVAVPRFSGWLILGLVIGAALMALVWKLRAFCQHLCPVAAFLKPYARLSLLALRTAKPDVCRRCAVHSCRQGSERGWACPFGLCVGEINENTHCGVCTECFKTCPYDNVTFRWRGFAQETAISTYGEAWLAMSMLTMGVAYCLVHLGHWPLLRDCVNIIDKGNWGLFALFALALWLAALAVVPAIVLAAAAMGRWAAGLQMPRLQAMKASCGALLPLGLAVWVAFVLPMFMVNVSFVGQSLSDPFGWGWDFFGTANTPWRQLFPRAIPWLQVAVILTGFYYSLRNAWRIWDGLCSSPRQALRGVIPMAILLAAASAGLVWFFAD